MHDAPPAMALALIVLAIGSVLAGYIGVPHALGGHNQLATWLEPSFMAGHANEAAAAETVAAEPATETHEADAGHDAAAEEALELTLMGVSSLIAVAGVAFGMFIWGKRRDIAASMARSFSGVHRLLLGKYFVDELYDAVIVRPLQALSREGLWRGFDVQVIDGAVNGTASIVAGGAAVLRRLQTRARCWSAWC
jgi:NADH-quinone oxidoreductase subunit L